MNTNEQKQAQEQSSTQTQPTRERKVAVRGEHDTARCPRCTGKPWSTPGTMWLGEAKGIGGCFLCGGKGSTRTFDLIEGSGWVTPEKAEKERAAQKVAAERRALRTRELAGYYHAALEQQAQQAQSVSLPD